MSAGYDPRYGTPIDPHGRIKRNERRKVNRRIYIAVGIAFLLVAASLGVTVTRAVQRANRQNQAPAAREPADLMMFVVQADQPFTAIVGTGTPRPPEIVAVPYNLLTTMPGAGLGSVALAVRQSAPLGRAVIANLLGAWIPHYVSISTDELSSLITQRGGITLNFTRAVRAGGDTFGPGPMKLQGPKVILYMTESRGGERNYRWGQVLEALFKEGSIPLSKAAQTDDLAAATATLAAARGAIISEFPSSPGNAGYRDADPETTSQMLASTFGIRLGLPEPVTLLNGIDRPALAQSVTSKLVPAGFRVAVYGDARGMHHEKSLIYVTNQEAVAFATKLKEALGVGRVLLSKQQSGLSDITVIVGKDYLALGR